MSTLHTPSPVGPSANRSIRAAVASDADHLAELACRVFAATYGSAIPAATLDAYLCEHFATAVFSARIATPPPLLVAVAGDGLAGYVQLDATPRPTCVSDPQAVELAQLYVDGPHQGCGVGAALLTAACAAVSVPIWLCVWERNDRALRFYARHGFVPVGHTKIYVHHVVFHDLVMMRHPAGLPSEDFYDR